MTLATLDQIMAELRLFKAYTLNNFSSNSSIIDLEFTESLNKDNTVTNKGLLIQGTPSKEIINIAEQLYGISSEEWNATFHKSFAKVINSDIETLIVDQIIHYFTTYGLENLGVFNSDYVYIPKEELNIPDMEKDFKLTVIKRITYSELKEKLLTLVNSGIALSKETIEDIMTLSDYFFEKDFKAKDIKNIKNREIRSLIFKKYNMVPYEAEDFLRWLLSETIDQSLIIKNKETIKKIKNIDSKILLDNLNKYLSYDWGYTSLAEIFLRYKNLFLAMKRSDNDDTSKAINKIINKLDKLSRVKGYHKPINSKIIDHITGIHSISIIELATSQIIKELDDITIFREIRILNSLSYRIQNNPNMVYKIRNGKVWTDNINDKYNIEEKNNQRLKANKYAYDLIYNHLKIRIYNLLKDKSIYIPDNIVYMAPTSEKQFLGNIPYGSYIKINRTNDMIIGIHWTNLDKAKVDLDLHMMNLTSQFGWNTAYRSDKGDIAFTGDITDAPKPLGATEAFLISNECENKSFLLKLNNFTKNSKPVPFEIVVAKGIGSKDSNRNFIIDPNDILIKIPSSFNKEGENNYDMSLGLVNITDDTIEFYFNKFDIGSNHITSNKSDSNMIMFKYLDNYYKSQLSIKQLLIDSGITLEEAPSVEKLEEVKITKEDGSIETLYRKTIEKVDYDLSLDTISKDSLIKLFLGE